MTDPTGEPESAPYGADVSRYSFCDQVLDRLKARFGDAPETPLPPEMASLLAHLEQDDANG